MPSMQEIELQSKALIELLAPIAKDIANLRQQNELLHKQLAELQSKEIDLDAIAQKAALLVEVKHGVDGAPGQDGASVTVEDLLPVVDKLVTAKFSEIEPPKNGEKGERGDPGEPGKSVTVEDLTPVLEQIVTAKFAEIEKPENGEKGDKGDPGEPGKSVTVDELLPVIENLVEKRVAEIPVPTNGIDGAPGADGKSVSKDDVLPELKSYAEAVLGELVAALPTPQDGKSVTAEEAAEIILPELKSYADDIISKIALPEPKSVSPEEVAELLESRVTESLGAVLESHVKTIKDAAEAVIAEIPAPANGKDGKDGASVSIDDLLPHVEKMAKELFNSIPKPKDGERGERGEPGKDATDIHILPAIDFEKSYPRGTWAHHNGGLYKSHANTLGERGWDCVINGIDAIDVDKSGDREITVKITDSRGEQVVKTFSMQNVIYQGIYDEKKDADYEDGDMVTCGGSVWHCLSKNPGRPGDSNPNWKLAVKRGQNGKDGRNGIDFTKPVTIGNES